MGACLWARFCQRSVDLLPSTASSGPFLRRSLCDLALRPLSHGLPGAEAHRVSTEWADAAPPAHPVLPPLDQAQHLADGTSLAPPRIPLPHCGPSPALSRSPCTGPPPSAESALGLLRQQRHPSPSCTHDVSFKGHLRRRLLLDAKGPLLMPWAGRSCRDVPRSWGTLWEFSREGEGARQLSLSAVRDGAVACPEEGTKEDANAEAEAVEQGLGGGQAKIRNVAIIAHVDHGKTTLMDRLLRHCGAVVHQERAMDSIALERERGITIASKYTSVEYRGHRLNLVDTPGHADFGGEVERVLGMVDGALLLVDALEGPLAQTKFVLAKALRHGLRPIVLLNKCDRPAVTEQVLESAESSIFDLFASFDATEEQLNFPVLYASGRQGWASASWPPAFPIPGHGLPQDTNSSPGIDSGGGPSMSSVLDAILEHVPPPPPFVGCTGQAPEEQPFRMLVSMVERDQYLGRLLVGRVASGRVKVGDRVHALEAPGASPTAPAAAAAEEGLRVDEGKVVKLVRRVGLSREEVASVGAGDIVAVAGLPSAFVSHTLAHTGVLYALPTACIDPPTISMTFTVNDSPLSGKEGTQMTGPKIGERLRAEAETNVSLAVDACADAADSAFRVMARGELQLGILIENMRREGFELSVSPPTVLYRTDEAGHRLEPLEEVMIEVEDEYTGAVIDALSLRKGEMLDMTPDAGGSGSGRTRLLFSCPSRGLLGFRSVLNTATHGTAVMHRSFLSYERFKGALDRVRRGVLVSMAPGITTGHALASVEARGTLFVSPGEETYDGHIIGENARDDDMEVNAVRTKELTNVRAAGKDENIRLTPPRQMNLEEAMAYVAEDELVEVTPSAIRLRKRILNSSRRKAARRPK